ncbi:MAG: FAD-dependent oxidoreductase [Actinomycetota bacterium]
MTSDLVVLGGGPAGYSCALRAADLGLSVTLVEADKVGDTCLHRGCVPTRAMLHAASLAHDAGAPAARWGIRATIDDIDVAQLLATRDDVVARNHKAVQGHLGAARVSVVEGYGTFVGRRTVVVGDERIEATRAVVLATGSAPRVLPDLPRDGIRVLTSDDAFALDRVPASALVLGGGAIGAEFSQIWNALGSDVTIVEIEDRLVPMEDADVGHELARALKRRGITVHVGTRLIDADARDDAIEVTLDTPSGLTKVSAEVLLLAIGRDPASRDLGYHRAGVETERGFVVPRDWSTLETHSQGIYAVGDLVPPPSHARAHVAYAEGMLVAERIAGETGRRGIDYTGVPRVTHGLTETACVGLSEDEARAVAGDVDTMKMPVTGVAKGLMVGDMGMAKVVAARDGNVLGIHLVGPSVTELIGEASAITNFEASPLDVAELVHAHPTLSETVAELSMALAGRPLHRR